jgi:hypothetical protein
VRELVEQIEGEVGRAEFEVGRTEAVSGHGADQPDTGAEVGALRV